MKIAVVYGSGRRGSTYNCVEIVKKALMSWGQVEFEEIWLPKALPEACCGCFNCIHRGEEYCPHSSNVSAIVDVLIKADGIILASPVYCLDVSGAMKTFLDHLCYLWMPHRPHGEMFSKIGFVISTAAGGGTKRTNKTMKLALDNMGAKRTFSYGVSVAASSWEDVNENKKLIIEKSLEKKAKKYFSALTKRKELSNRLYTKMFFSLMKGMISKYKDGNYDKEYWSRNGWLNNQRPF